MAALAVCAVVIICAMSHMAHANICCSYQQFEADGYQDSGYVFIDMNRLGTTYSYSNYTYHLVYDKLHNRTYLNVTTVEVSPIIPQPIRQQYELINDFNKRIQYMFHDNVCHTFTLGALEPFCIPDDAIQMSTGYIGNNQTYLVTYLVNFPPDPTTYTVSIDPRTCVPAFTTYTTSATVTDSGQLNSVVLSNIAPGISQPSVFNVPNYCSSAKLSRMDRRRTKLARPFGNRFPHFTKM